MNQWTDGRTEGRMDKASYRVACPQLIKTIPFPHHSLETKKIEIFRGDQAVTVRIQTSTASMKDILCSSLEGDKEQEDQGRIHRYPNRVRDAGAVLEKVTTAFRQEQ